MKYKIKVSILNTPDIHIELNEMNSPKTVGSFLDNLPFTVRINLWGEEIYTDESPINISEENSKPLVELNDVAYWPTGKAICLFFGPTPIGKKGEIKPYSPVNIIGKIMTSKDVLSKIKEGTEATFELE
jgi:hypothetical protein